MKCNRSVLLRNNPLSIALLLCASTIAVLAQSPNQSRRVENVPWSMQDCMARAKQALQQQGYNIDWTGNDAYRGVKGANSALILCNAGIDRRTRVNVIVASNSNAADSENAALWTSLRGSAADRFGSNTPVSGFDSGNTPVSGFGSGQYLGCWRDDASRVLNVNGGNTNDMTNSKCTSICQAKGAQFAATQYGSYCYCGNDYRRLGQLDDNACNVGCKGDQSQKCGGSWANSVYAVNASSSNFGVSPSSTPSNIWNNVPSVSNATYLGCWKDDASRVLHESAGNTNDMTNNKCTSLCRAKGMPFAATEYGSYCFCGNDYRRLGRLAENECNVGCSGDPSQKCGGSWANSVYAVQ